MKCQDFQDECAGYLEELLDESRRKEFESHLAECPDCRSELEAVRKLTVRLKEDGLDAAPVSMENVVMDRIFREQAIVLRRMKMKRRIRFLGLSGAMAATIVVLIVGTIWPTRSAIAEKAAAEVMACGAEAASNPATVHIVAKMRTLPGDNFAYINAACDFVPVEIWTQANGVGKWPKWRVEKPGRVIVMDGKSTTMLMRPNEVVQLPIPTWGAFDSRWLLELANVKDMLSRELRNAQAQHWNLSLAHETTAGGENAVVTVDAKSELPPDDYLRNKFFDDSDTRRVYRFDVKTQRLVGYDAYLRKPDGDVLIIRVKQIKYNQEIEPGQFALKLPDKVYLHQEPQPVADNEKYEKMTPDQAARAFFEACGRKDWEEVEKFHQPVTDSLKEHYGGLKLIEIGKPFQSAISLLNGDWFVPYEIRLPEKQKFIISNDNAAKRYIVIFADEMPDKDKLAEVKKLPDNEKYEKMTAEEAARTFFDAYANKDVEGVRKLTDGSGADDIWKQMMDVFTYTDVEIGEPVQNKETGAWQVSAEATVIKKWNVALRPNKTAKRYIVDGGI